MICHPPRISCSPSVLSLEGKKKMARATFPLLLLLLLSVQGQSRLITDHSSPDLISDGIRHVGQHSLLLLERLSSNSSEACEQTYGFLPCTTTVLGNLFLVLVYGCLMFLAAKFLSTGSELLLELLGPGIVGGLFLPILGALPDALLILVSGLSGSKETAQHQVLIGMGLLAGSTVMLLTLLWGSCVIVGKCDLLDHSTSIDSQDTKRCSLTGSGVTTDLQTSHAAKIMAISVIPFIIVQLPLIFNLQSERRLGILVGLIVAIAFLIAYCLYQVFQPWIQKRRLAYAKHKHVIAGILRHSEAALGRLLKEDGQPDTDVMKKLFKRIDEDNDTFLSIRELTALIIGIKFDEIDLDRDDAVKKVMVEFDSSNDNQLSEEEFVSGLSKWVDHAKRSVSHATIDQNRLIHDFHHRTKEEHDMLIDRSDEVVESIDNPYWIYAKAISLLLLGAVIAAAFADPLVDAVTNFSNATSIPTFFISFIAMPLATNSSEAVSAIIFASRKKQRTTSLTFSEIYGGVTMNNILCLAVFLGLVYARHLTWDFSAEVLVILIVTVVMALFTCFRTTFPLWTCAVAFIFYPFSLVLVYLLDYVFGWS